MGVKQERANPSLGRGRTVPPGARVPSQPPPWQDRDLPQMGPPLLWEPPLLPTNDITAPPPNSHLCQTQGCLSLTPSLTRPLPGHYSQQSNAFSGTSRHSPVTHPKFRKGGVNCVWGRGRGGGSPGGGVGGERLRVDGAGDGSRGEVRCASLIRKDVGQREGTGPRCWGAAGQGPQDGPAGRRAGQG